MARALRPALRHGGNERHFLSAAQSLGDGCLGRFDAARIRVRRKASRFLTHQKRLGDLEAGLERFFEPLQPLVAAGKLGPVLWQLPPRFRRDDDRLAAALARLPPGRHAFEFRDPSWFVEAVYAILRGHGAALVLADHPRRAFQTHELTAAWTFLRFHHGCEHSGGDYSAAELDTWARRIGRWRARGEVYAYFNNDWNAYAVQDAPGLARRGVSTRGVRGWRRRRTA